MKRRYWMAVAGLACALTLGCGAWAAKPDERQQVSRADQALFLGLAHANATAIGKLLDPKFTWTDVEGRTLGLKAVLKAPPKPGAQVGANLTLHLYGNVAVITTALEHIHTLRVWVKGSLGWRALLYQEVKVDQAIDGGGKRIESDCDNPCHTIPYTPRTTAERDVIAAWQALEGAVAKGDAGAWAGHVADEFTVVNGAHVEDKVERMTAVGRGGSAPAPLVSATLLDFSDAIVMTSLHQPYVGKPIHVSRVWVHRNDAWLLVVSYQTVVQAAKVG